MTGLTHFTDCYFTTVAQSKNNSMSLRQDQLIGLMVTLIISHELSQIYDICLGSSISLFVETKYDLHNYISSINWTHAIPLYWGRKYKMAKKSNDFLLFFRARKTNDLHHRHSDICLKLSPFDHQEQNYHPAPVYYI